MLNLEIVTPEKKVLSETVDAVTIPTASGEIGILQNHAPLISSLKAGVLSYTRSGTTERMVIAGGFVEVSQNNVSILSDIAETAGEINVENARAERDSAERELGAWRGSLEEAEAERERLEIAQARLQLSSIR
ncbi:MAG TPA: F0F1 ATP synthase subunit epsilon [Pyrinomonadaceae bacterium]|nr:F0F1 ATP synthase subunit epsilon [Pyrinomonadaceae bacterium]